MVTALTIVFGTVFVWILFGFLTRRYAKWHRRKGNLQSFRAEFDNSDYCSQAIDSAYYDLSEACGMHVYRLDELEASLGLSEDDVKELLQKRFSGLGTISEGEASQYSNHLPIWTVEEYVGLVAVSYAQKTS